ncbi:MAG: hypothetical protein AABW59_02670 [archaeon]
MAPPPETYHVRPVKLLREGEKYHDVEKIRGPNLLDLIYFAESGKGPRLKEEAHDKTKKWMTMSLEDRVLPSS